MTRRDPDLALRQMTEHAREVVAMVAGRSRADLDTDRQLELSVVRHGYDSVDLDIVWEIVTRDIPALLRELERDG